MGGGQLAHSKGEVARRDTEAIDLLIRREGSATLIDLVTDELLDGGMLAEFGHIGAAQLLLLSPGLQFFEIGHNNSAYTDAIIAH